MSDYVAGRETRCVRIARADAKRCRRACRRLPGELSARQRGSLQRLGESGMIGRPRAAGPGRECRSPWRSRRWGCPVNATWFRPETGAKRNGLPKRPRPLAIPTKLPGQTKRPRREKTRPSGRGTSPALDSLACRSLLLRHGYSATARTARAAVSSAAGACRSSATSATPVPRAARGPAAATSRPRSVAAGAGRSRATRRGRGWRPCGRGRAWPRTRR